MNVKRNSNQKYSILEKKTIEEKLQYLFAQSMNGDTASYEDFLNLVSALVKRNLYFMTRDRISFMDIEDLHQEVMLKVHAKKHTYKHERAIVPWINAIVKYSYIDFYRTQKKYFKNVELSDEHLSGLFTKEAEGFEINLEELMELLTSKQQELIKLTKIDGINHVDVARTLNISVASVKVNIHRIIKKLRTKVKND